MIFAITSWACIPKHSMEGCECEDSQQSPYSPGLVQPGEGIVYCLIHPVDIADPVTLAEASSLMPREQLAETRLSVCRANHSTREIVQREVIDVRLGKPGRSFVGCWSAICQTIRELRSGDGRAICVVDAGLPHYTGHAHLGFTQVVAAANRSVQVAAKGELLKAFKEAGVLPLVDCFAT